LASIKKPIRSLELFETQGSKNVPNQKIKKDWQGRELPVGMLRFESSSLK